MLKVALQLAVDVDTDFTTQSVGGVHARSQPHYRIRLFSNAGSGKIIRDQLCFPDGSLRVRPSLSTEKMFFYILICSFYVFPLRLRYTYKEYL